MSDENSKSSVYRQLYHAANDLENRYARPSASGFSTVRGGASPLLSRKALAASVALGVTLLGVYAVVKSISKDAPASEESEEEAVDPVDSGTGSEDEEAVEDPGLVTEDEELVVGDTGDGLWSKVTRWFGLGTREDNVEDPPPVDEPSTQRTPPVEPISTPEVPESKAKVGTKGSPSQTSAPKQADSSPVFISRGAAGAKSVRLLSEKEKQARAFPERTSAASSLFVGRYARLARASLTEPEAAWAMRLVRMGAPIHGRTGRAFLPIVEAAIRARAIAHGLDPEEMLKVASIESGGDPNAVSGTGAIGIFQFTAGTANLFSLRNRFNMDANIEAGMLLTKDNNKRLPDQVQGPLATYISHQIGISSAKEVLTSDRNRPIRTLRKSTRKNISVNVGGKSTTVGEYLDANRAKLEQSYNSQVTAAPFRGTIKVAQGSSGEKVSSLGIEVPDSEGGVSYLKPVTVSVKAEEATPDINYSHKNVDVQAPSAPSGEEVVASASSPNLGMGQADADEYPQGESSFKEVFRLGENGPLVVM